MIIRLMDAFMSIFFKSTHSTAGLDTLKPAATSCANIHPTNVLTFTVQKYIYPLEIIWLRILEFWFTVQKYIYPLEITWLRIFEFWFTVQKYIILQKLYDWEFSNLEGTGEWSFLYLREGAAGTIFRLRVRGENALLLMGAGGGGSNPHPLTLVTSLPDQSTLALTH